MLSPGKDARLFPAEYQCFCFEWHGLVAIMPPLWRDGREAEGAPLLREYRVKSLIEGSNPSLSAIHRNMHISAVFIDAKTSGTYSTHPTRP